MSGRSFNPAMMPNNSSVVTDRRWSQCLTVDPEPGAGLYLVPNVDLRSRIIADEYNGEPGRASIGS